MLLAALAASGVVLVVLPGLLRRFGRRIDPEEWAVLCAVALVGGGVAIELALIGQAAPTVLRAFGVTALADACERMVGAWVPGGPTAGWGALGVAAAMPALAIAGVRRTRRSWARVHIEPGLGRREEFQGVEVAVLATQRVVAFSVRHRGHDQIVVSDSLFEQLSDREVEAVLRHERAHLGLRHDRYLLTGAAIEHAFARIRPVARSVASLFAALERSADERAAGTSVERRRNLRSALLGVATTRIAVPVAALHGSDTIVHRLDALGEPPLIARARMRLMAYAPLVCAALVGSAALGLWLGRLPAVVAMARCPVT